MIEKLHRSAGRVIGFKLSDKLHDADYKTFVPAIDAIISTAEKARILAWFHDFHGWDAKALWDDIKFSTTHCSKVDRIALVGEKTWEKWMAQVCKPFTMAKIRYFEASQVDEAWQWLEEK
jgi:hypothetical protein